MAITVRPARASDADALGRMGAELVRQHHGFDPERFMLPDDVEALVRRFAELGVPRVILMTAAKNEGAQRFFARLGWRTTMVEMTREIPEPGNR